MHPDLLQDPRSAILLEALRESEPCVSHESQASPADASVAVGPALTPNQSLVPRTMDGFGALELVSTKGIAERMEPSERFSPRTIGPLVQRCIQLRLAERPEGDRSGARLTLAGRGLAKNIAE
ncbi:hypothetical protein [Leptolyngbya sp. 7M]|uniref:hypothetical protein n=1 Tax=Leptolyngbya sp. 7M TaxID=2812896 RepID=UPI001B8BB3E8|nr:hypothetical protein [Leptolyngbya sp. 7M]QYO63316.1 hypothetical protein JVX88_25815 [Leptolyngbya sp. 7M]